ncbi:uncharacterized protein LOC121237166 isoform X1 [Juglans microcarpa x Juglans regia]|uniref:uncharacterized protein LOC121237166 isoform X1 n=2 Tax=Juglans microcarpa x Juglans regia TaxID=2249226 RepID=UPI001B7F2FA9|nr:uncharacterized protein LOC121237166 isoform X1 [Juglans microcarpa x Juglans regia]
MGLLKLSWALCWVLYLLSFRALCDYSGVTVKFLKAPNAFSHLNSATFVFEVFMGGDGTCANCIVSCKLDDGIASDCEARRIFYAGLQDGNHTFEVCTNRSGGVGCANYSWTVDTVPPTAYITALTPFTNALNVSVNISFSEPCTGGGGFECSSVKACNLLVYGAGQVIPSSLIILQPNLKYSVLVGLSSASQYGRVILVMDKNFCTDSAGNKFTRTTNSSFYVHFDRRSVFVNLRTGILERLLQLNGKTRLVQATNKYNKLRVYLYFSVPVLNSSAEIVNSLQTSQGTLLPISGKNLGNRRFGFLVANLSGIAIVTLSIDSNSIISRQSTPVSPIAPVTFLYDSLRPAVRLSTSFNMRTKEPSIPMLIKFMKPVFGFNASEISINGGHLQSFHEISRAIYIIEIHADHDIVSVSVPENVTRDVAGNGNLASNVLQVRHYSVPVISSVISELAIASFLVTSFASGLLMVSIASLHSIGALSRPSSSFSDPTRNLFRIACHIQVFALSRWLAVTLPVEYDEFARGLQWSIPYLSLPWETGHTQPVIVGSSSPDNPISSMYEVHYSGTFQNVKWKEEILGRNASIYGLPLTPMEYRSYFESQNSEPKAEYILDPHILNGWRDFGRSMFWLATIGGSLILLHALLLVILKFRKKNSGKQSYGALALARFEIFLIILAVPCICAASVTLIRGGTALGIMFGILLLGAMLFLLLALFLFLSVGITFGKLLQYKEIHQEGRRFHWYQHIVRVTLGPGKRGQWTWKNQPNSDYLIKLGPLFEDLRGPPKYMLSQISGSNPSMHGDQIIASDDETEDAEAPLIQKLFGILRIYYTLLESMRRVSLGIFAGAYKGDRSSKTPTITLLCITSFQLFFLVLKKPFIKKKVQLIEIISVSSEVCLFATFLVLMEKKLSDRDETLAGVFMLILFLLGYIPQMMNEWYALYRQTKRLDNADNFFSRGMKIALIGFLLLFIPQKLIKKLESRLRQNVVTGSSVESSRNSGSRGLSTTDKSRSNQLKELAKASFSKEESRAPNDPSTSRTRWNRFWGNKSSGSSSVNSSSDFKSKQRELDKDLEAIFASK